MPGRVLRCVSGPLRRRNPTGLDMWYLHRQQGVLISRKKSAVGKFHTRIEGRRALLP